MPTPKWYVQTKGEDGLFRTVEDGEHENVSTAFEQYSATAYRDREADEPDAPVVQLVRGDHVVLRSDRHDWNPQHESQEERAAALF